MKNVLLTLALFVAMASAMKLRDTRHPGSPKRQVHHMTFDEYVNKFEKQYTEDEYPKREKLFNERVAVIKEVNTDESSSWTAGINKFTDMTAEEQARYRGLKKHWRGLAAGGTVHNSGELALRETSIPLELDWRKKPGQGNAQVLTSVKDQGSCGSCWAYAVAGVLESQLAMNTGTSTDLSEEEMISCTPNPKRCGGSGGCDGATEQLAMEYVKQHGLALDVDLPDTSKDGSPHKCLGDDHPAFIQKYKRSIHIDDYRITPENDKSALMQMVVQYGPAVVGVDANHWFLYDSGIFTKCPRDNSVNTNHAVVLVGWGEQKGVKFWSIKNSWGGWWGENGYMRLIRQDDDESQCWMDKNPQEGNECALEFGGRSEVKTCGACGIILGGVVPVGTRLA